MVQQLLDPMTDVSAWVTADEGGVPDSPQLDIRLDTTQYRFGEDRTSLRIAAGMDALDHTFSRVFNPPLDLQEFSELRFQIRSTRAAGTSNFYLEVRLGSSTLPADDPANEWQRFIPVPRENQWNLVRLHLHDLNPAVHGDLARLQFRCVDATASFVLHLDDLLAVHEEMLRDVDRVLLERLHEQLIFNGNAVPAVIRPDEPADADAPYIQLIQDAVQESPQRRPERTERSDFNANGFYLLPEAKGYDLYYTVQPQATERRAVATMLEFVLAALDNQRLISNGMELVVQPAPPALDSEETIPDARLRYVIHTRRERREPVPALTPYNEIIVQANQFGS